MNKLIFTLIFTCGTYIYALAQNNEIEAKAAYLLAEESFQQRDYISTLEYLNNAKKSLGKTNSKLLYLQIQTELELYKSDQSYYEKILKSIAEFQSSSDVKNFTEEKVLEVAKLKMQIINSRKKELEDEKISKDKEDEFSKKFREYSFKNWPYGVTLEELKTTHKDSAVFKGRLKSVNIVNNVDGKYIKSDKVENIRGIYSASYGLENTVISIITQGNIVKGYKKVIYNQYNLGGISVSSNTKKTYFDAKKEIQDIVSNLTNEFGFPPISTNKTYLWVKENKRIFLHDKSFSNNNNYTRWQCEAVLEISEL